MMDKSQGRVVLNLTIGIDPAPGQALVFHVGTAIYAMEGFALQGRAPGRSQSPANPRSLADLERLLEVHTHDKDNFSTPEGIDTGPLTGSCKGPGRM